MKATLCRRCTGNTRGERCANFLITLILFANTFYILNIGVVMCIIQAYLQKVLVKFCSMCYHEFITAGKSFAKALQALRQAHFTFCRGGKAPLL